MPHAKTYRSVSEERFECQTGWLPTHSYLFACTPAQAGSRTRELDKRVARFYICYFPAMQSRWTNRGVPQGPQWRIYRKTLLMEVKVTWIECTTIIAHILYTQLYEGHTANHKLQRLTHRLTCVTSLRSKPTRPPPSRKQSRVCSTA